LPVKNNKFSKKKVSEPLIEEPKVGEKKKIVLNLSSKDKLMK
jgi:hypothetical protein